MFKSYAYFILLTTPILFFSCSDKIVDSCDLEDAGFKGTFTEVQTEIFNKSCIGCHGGSAPSGDLNLESGQSYQNIINISNSSGTDSLVVPGNPAGSYLISRMKSSSGDVMPPAGNLQQNLLNLIDEWVAEGAQNN